MRPATANLRVGAAEVLKAKSKIKPMEGRFDCEWDKKIIIFVYNFPITILGGCFSLQRQTLNFERRN